jgi:zinc protease
MVQPDAVREAAARYLQPDNVAAVVYLPEDLGPELTVSLLERTFAITALRGSPPAQLASHKRVPPVTGVSGRWEAEVLHTPLAGVDLLVRRKSGVPLVTVGLYVPRVEFEPTSQAGLGALTIRSSVRGAGNLDAGGLAFAFERLGGTLSASSGSDWLGFGASVLAEHLGEAAALLDLVFTVPRLADSEVSTECGLMLVEAEQVADDMFRYPFQLAFGEAFGDTGYGVPVGGLPDTLANISAVDVRTWHSRALLGVRPVVLAVGDMEPEQATATLAGVFRDRPALTNGGRLSPVQWVGGGGESSTRVVTRAKAQAALAMIFPGPGRRDKDRLAAQVWAAVASGLGGRIFEALRDRRSLAYTVLASSWQKGRAGALVTYIATSPEREEEARTAILEELDRFTRAQVSGAELAQAINYLAGQAEVGRQSAGALAGEILEAWLIGNGLADLENPGAAFRKVTADDVRRVAEQNLQPSRRAEGVVRGTGIVGPSPDQARAGEAATASR